MRRRRGARCWRDRGADGRFVTGVLSTGIYCRPSCAAHHPKRGNVRFFADGAAARASGLRACLRCRPDERARDADGVARAVALIERAETPPTLAEMAAAGYAPHHFHRLFRKCTGVTPAAYAHAVRARRMERALRREDSIIGAIYEAGFSGPARFYDSATGRLGMAPSTWRDDGHGAVIRWASTATSLGPILVAATERGLCHLAFGSDPAMLERDFPHARIEAGGAAMVDLVASAVAAVEEPGRARDLPLDVRGTAFQEAVWRELGRVPPDETTSHAAPIRSPS